MNIKSGILKALTKADDGLTICNLMDKTGYSRGGIKINLLYLMLDGSVKEIAYSKNTKVYKINKELKQVE